ncbi:MAG: trypsin-like peptidase domain-containing protein [Pirellulaceae bacterium]|nr:trypsin-like peptidase domain-containing protein [Pirellulaceae bacterium]
MVACCRYLAVGLRPGLILLALSCLAVWPPDARSQDPSAVNLTPAEREQMFRELADEVAALERQGALLKKAVRLIRPTVVHIEAKKLEDGRRKTVEEAGSGVIIELNTKFYVLTNRHVILDAPMSGLELTLADGRPVRPVRVWSDQSTDVAVIAVADTDLVAARLGDSSKLEIGDFVLAVGSPFGLSHSVTFGIISAKGRHDLELGSRGVELQDFLQTDAAINPGNSGGPLLNLRGEVVGINTAIASSGGGNEGIGFSIPINMAVSIARQLVEKGSVSRAFLGVLLDADYNTETAVRLGLPRRFGARIKAVTQNSAAEAAQLQVGDIILEYDGIRIENDDHLIDKVSVTPIGQEVTLRVFRAGRPMSVHVRVRERGM